MNCGLHLLSHYFNAKLAIVKKCLTQFLNVAFGLRSHCDILLDKYVALP